MGDYLSGMRMRVLFSENQQRAYIANSYVKPKRCPL